MRSLLVTFLGGALLGFSVLVIACGEDAEPIAPAGSSSSGGSSSGQVFKPNDAGSGDSAGNDEGCSENAKLVYVLSQEKDLYRFNPPKLTFTKVGTLSCPGATGATVSMAIDRAGTAWVNYADGKLFKVSTDDAKCTDSGFVPNQAGFLKMGMAFASDAPGSKTETLYISGVDAASKGKGLGKIDTKSLELTMIADYPTPLTGAPAELTGNSEGKLFGFFAATPTTFAEIAPATAATSNTVALDVGKANAFAFSFWGGDFYFYTSDGATPSKVTQRKSTGETSVVLADVGKFRIVGAGVSTCAPLTQPK